jgi:hypothetical protein
MDKLILVSILTLWNFSIKAQVKDYFIPASTYINERFNYEGRIYETENGQFQTKNSVNYSLDPSGNYMKLIENYNYRYNLLQLKLNAGHFYNVTEERVADIYFYLEGISEVFDPNGFKNSGRNIIILKYPGSKWVDKKDPDVEEHYKSEFCTLKTEYGEYSNCIVVTKTLKAISKEFAGLEKFEYKYYYAYKLGLIKTEILENKKLINADIGYGGTLIDYFSEYSYYIKTQEEKRREEEAKKHKMFLEERRITNYSLQTIKFQEYLKIKKDIEIKIQTILNEFNNMNASFTIMANYTIDTLSNNNNEIEFSGLEDSELKNALFKELKEVYLESVILNNYKVNAQAKFDIEISQSNSKYTIVKKQTELFLSNGNVNLFNKYKNTIWNKIEQDPDGKYEIELYTLKINDKTESIFNYISYKSFGGPASSFLSIIIPGTGDYLVNGGKGSMFGNIHPLITTLGVYGMVGTGFYFKSLSNKNYKLYHQVTEQKDLDKYYNAANSQNKTALTMLGVGGVLWASNIFWVIKKGANNNKIERDMRHKLNLSIAASFNTFTLTYNF